MKVESLLLGIIVAVGLTMVGCNDIKDTSDVIQEQQTKTTEERKEYNYCKNCEIRCENDFCDTCLGIPDCVHCGAKHKAKYRDAEVCEECSILYDRCDSCKKMTLQEDMTNRLCPECYSMENDLELIR